MQSLDAQLIHDMRNAVSVIRSAALQLGEDDELPTPVVHRLAEMIARRGDLLGQLLDDLSTADSLERGELSIARQRVVLDDVCREALAHRALPAQVVLAFDVAAEAVVLSDPTRVLQILDNLVTNAVRYGGPHITIRAHRDADVVHLQVIDDGPGVPAALRESMFDAYARGRDSAPAGGSGLGLAIVARLSLSLGGSVAYEHEQGCSTFTVKLPAVPQASRVPQHDIADHGHSVAFWYDESSLVRRITGYAALGLTRGEAVLLAVTRERGDAVEAELSRLGIDVEAVTRSGQLVRVDAGELHDGLVRDGRVDPELFEALIGTAVAAMESRWRSVRAFGEIVDLYWQRGDGHLAVQLESCWNDLRRRHDFPLLCAYQVAADAAVGELSDCHDAVVAA